MSNEEADVPFWRKPLPPIPGPTASRSAVIEKVGESAEPTRVPSAVQARDEIGPRVPQMVAQGRESQTAVQPDVPPVDPYTAAKVAEHALDLARAQARKCRTATMAARTAFSVALADWSRGEPIQTQEMQARAFIRQSNEDRAARAAAGRLPYRPTVTATARAMAGGNQRHGGGSAYRRGPGGAQAFTKAEAMTVEANRLRAAAAAAVKPRGQ